MARHQSVIVMSDREYHAKDENCGAVYIVQMGDSDIYKIGITRNVPQRLGQIQTGNPYPIKLIFDFYKENAKQTEQKIHKRYGKHRMMGEWFRLPKDEVEKIIRNKK